MHNKGRACNICNTPHKRQNYAYCKTCETFGKYRFMFGKHEGFTLMEAFNRDKEYMIYMKGQYENREDNNNSIARFLERIEIITE
jgi:hypothetical protein